MSQKYKVLVTSLGNNLNMGPFVKGNVITEEQVTLNGESQLARLLEIKALAPLVEGDTEVSQPRPNGIAPVVGNPLAGTAPSAQIAVLNANAADLNARLVAEIGAHDATKADAATAASDAQAKIAELTRVAETKDEQIATLTMERNSAGQYASEAQAKIAEMANSCADKDMTIGELNAQIASLTAASSQGDGGQGAPPVDAAAGKKSA
jgi:hypothetical protein